MNKQERVGCSGKAVTLVPCNRAENKRGSSHDLLDSILISLHQQQTTQRKLAREDMSSSTCDSESFRRGWCNMTWIVHALETCDHEMIGHYCIL